MRLTTSIVLFTVRLTPFAHTAFQVLFSNQGSQGLLRKPSDQQLENEFGTKKDVDVVEQILTKGVLQQADAIRSGPGATNISKGSFSMDTRGKNSSGIARA